MITKKILALCMSQDRGGLELYFLKFVKYYTNSNLFVACTRDSYITKNIFENKLECKPRGFINKILNFFKIRKYIVDKDIDIIHVSWSKDLFLAILLKVFSKKYLKIIFYRQMKISRSKRDLFHKFVYSNVDIFLVITRKLYNEACNYLPIHKSKIHVLEYGINTPSKDSIVDKKKFYLNNNLDNSIFLIGVFSRIEEQKGQHLVLNAISQSKHEIQLCIIGHSMDDKYKQRLQSNALSLNIHNNVHFIDFIDSPMSYMPCFDLIILPTYEETFGLIIAEAMMMEVPVIGSNAGGVPEIINHQENGLLFESKNIADLRKKIDFIIEKKAFTRQIVNKAFKYANERYDYEKHFVRFEELIMSSEK